MGKGDGVVVVGSTLINRSSSREWQKIVGTNRASLKDLFDVLNTTTSDCCSAVCFRQILL
ncbi:hypothetical protein D3C80_1841970 [compost metagenome]